jgi:hypothetical protein
VAGGSGDGVAATDGAGVAAGVTTGVEHAASETSVAASMARLKWRMFPPKESLFGKQTPATFRKFRRSDLILDSPDTHMVHCDPVQRKEVANGMVFMIYHSPLAESAAVVCVFCR